MLLSRIFVVRLGKALITLFELKCRDSMKMSPLELVRNVPFLRCCEAAVEHGKAFRDESERADPIGCDATDQGAATDAGSGSGCAWLGLSADQACLAPLPGGRGRRVGASWTWAIKQPGQTG